MLSFPPHCSHKLQPLDRSVFGPFKKYVNADSSSWMLTNPGKTMTIYNLPGIVGQAYPKAFTPLNISARFRVSGIFPFDRDIFGDEEFMPANVNDRPLPEANPGPCEPTATTTQNCLSPVSSSSLEEIRPIPKASPRVENRKGRKRGSTRILTDTPVKKQIESEHLQRQEKNNKRKGVGTKCTSRPIVNSQDRTLTLPALITRNKMMICHL